MKKLLMISLAVVLSLLLGGAISGNPSYAFSGFTSNDPSITADPEFPATSIAYDDTLRGASDYARSEEYVRGPVVYNDPVSPPPSIAFDKSLDRCVPSYALNSDLFRGPVVSSEFHGATQGTEDSFTALAMLCK